MDANNATPQIDGNGQPQLNPYMLGSLRFNPPKEYDGTIDDFPDFSFKLKAYLSLVDHMYPHYMNFAEASETPLHDGLYVDANQQPNHAALNCSRVLFNTLTMLCTHSALTVVKQLGEAELNMNGFEAWRRF